MSARTSSVSLWTKELALLAASVALVACNPTADTCVRPAATSPPPVALADDAVEQVDLAGDFELLDPAAETFETLGGVVPTLSDLEIPLTKRTSRYIEHFGISDKGRKAFFDRYHRASKYRELIEHKLRDRDLPQDLLWLVAIESAFKVQATSAAGAVGLFQFMPATAQRFDLRIADGIDERRSIPKSTDAAIAYLTFLYERFGAWDLALAAYNCGEDRIDEALFDARDKLERREDEPVSLYELAELELVPKETAHFVPMIHAFAIVAHNRELLDLEDEEPLEPMRFAEIAVPAGTRLAPIAKAADVSIAVLREYNPDILGFHLPEGSGDRLVQIPADTLEHTLAALPSLLEREAERIAEKQASATDDVAREEAEKEKAKEKAKKKKSKRKPIHGERVTLSPSLDRPDLYVLPSGILVDLVDEPGETIAVRARIDVVDPTNGSKKIGASFETEERRAKVGELGTALGAVRKDLSGLVFGEAAKKLREHLAKRRKSAYEKRGAYDLFAALSERAFPEGHPMRGALLVGSTEIADDMFLEPEPRWGLQTVVKLRGPVGAESIPEDLHKALGAALTPGRLPALPSSARFAVTPRGREVVVAWASPPIDEEREAAAHLAFILGCGEKLGRAHIALRRGSSVAANVRGGLEIGALATVGWMYAMPIEPATAEDVDGRVESAIEKLVQDGPTESEVVAARAILRTELVREREMARLRGLPRGHVVATMERILAKLADTDAADVAAAAKLLFAKEHRIVITGG